MGRDCKTKIKVFVFIGCAAAFVCWAAMTSLIDGTTKHGISEITALAILSGVGTIVSFGQAIAECLFLRLIRLLKPEFLDEEPEFLDEEPEED